MNAIDTNVLIYRLDRHDPVKHVKARDLLRRLASQPIETVLPWQVIGELVRQRWSWQDQRVIVERTTRRYVRAFRNLFPLVMPTPAVLDRALDLGSRYSLSHWDTMLLGACEEAGVDTRYTEDMGAPIVYGTMNLVNPFL